MVKECVTYLLAAAWRRKNFPKSCWVALPPMAALAMPETYPKFDTAELEKLRSLNYPELAFEILSRFADDIPAD